jgi:hypothetical protein
MKTLFRPVAAVFAACIFAASAFAIDPSGNWTWTQMVRGVERESRLTLILKGKRVVGSLTAPGPRGEVVVADVRDGTFDGDMVTFLIERDVNGQKFTAKYRGRVLGSMINGTVESPGVTGLVITRDWVAKRIM